MPTRGESAGTPKSIWEQDTLTGDWGGARTALKDKGIDIYARSISARRFAVLSGGHRARARSYEGRFEFSVDTDLQKLIGWTGATTHVTVYQIHNGGHNAADNVGSIADPSNIDALPTTRLFTAWFQQNCFDDRSRCASASSRPTTNSSPAPTAGGLINGTFGWAGILAANMLSGGPAYPLATPGARLAGQADRATRRAGARCSPAIRPGAIATTLPQECNRYGTTFSFSGGALGWAKLQYAINQGKDADGLPGVYKLGAWYATAEFADQHFGLDATGAHGVARPIRRRRPAQSQRQLGHLRRRRPDGLARRQDAASTCSCAAASRRPTAIWSRITSMAASASKARCPAAPTIRSPSASPMPRSAGTPRRSIRTRSRSTGRLIRCATRRWCSS